MSQRYRVGIVGSGFGVKAHLPAFRAHPKFEVVALASPQRAAQLAAKHEIPYSFAGCRQMLDGCDLDVLSIAAPPFTHRDDVLASLRAGKHVLCEKPFALSVEQAETMCAAAHETSAATAVMHEFRYIPERVALKEMIDNGHLAPLRQIEFTHLATWLRAADHERKRSWWFDRQSGGGIAGAQLSHAIDTVTWLAGRPPARSAGYLRTANPQRHDATGGFVSTVDDGAFVLIDYGDGLVARATCDATQAVDSFTLAVHAENRTAVASGTSVHDLRLFAVDTEETSELQCAPLRYKRFESLGATVPLMLELLDEFVKQIETGTSAVPTFEEALATQRVLASIGYGT